MRSSKLAILVQYSNTRKWLTMQEHFSSMMLHTITQRANEELDQCLILAVHFFEPWSLDVHDAQAPTTRASNILPPEVSRMNLGFVVHWIHYNDITLFKERKCHLALMLLVWQCDYCFVTLWYTDVINNVVWSIPLCVLVSTCRKIMNTLYWAKEHE